MNPEGIRGQRWVTLRGWYRVNPEGITITKPRVVRVRADHPGGPWRHAGSTPKALGKGMGWGCAFRQPLQGWWIRLGTDTQGGPSERAALGIVAESRWDSGMDYRYLPHCAHNHEAYKAPVRERRVLGHEAASRGSIGSGGAKGRSGEALYRLIAWTVDRVEATGARLLGAIR